MTTSKTSDTQERTLAWFRTLEPVNAADMIGLWKGSGCPSGHPLDGVLENLGWFGKRFHSDLRADALLFERAPGKLIAIEPAYFPIRWALSFAGIGKRLRHDCFRTSLPGSVPGRPQPCFNRV